MKRGAFGQWQLIVKVIADRPLELGYLQLVIDLVTDRELLVGQPPARLEIGVVAGAIGLVSHRGDKGLLPSRQPRIALRKVNEQLQPFAINGRLFLRHDSGRRFPGHGSEIIGRSATRRSTHSSEPTALSEPSLPGKDLLSTAAWLRRSS